MSELKANNPDLKSWVEVSENSDFPIQNLPLGLFTQNGESPRACSCIGEFIVDLQYLHKHHYLMGLKLEDGIFNQPDLNKFISLGKVVSSQLRQRLSDILDIAIDFNQASKQRDHFLIPISEVKLLLPIKIGDYTDFYSSKEHATNVGIMFRDPDNALLPNWLHLPVGYHGRSSSISVSGTPVRRPFGQMLPDGETKPVFGPCRLLDFELEMGFVIGKENSLGQPISIQKAEDYIFGLMLFNDWSARDIQKWEYVPLGPFGAKNFASTVSPWIVLLEALEPFRVEGPVQEPEVLPYLKHHRNCNFNIELFVDITTESGITKTVTHSNFKHMYWSMAQQLTHHTITGCNMRVGDMCASGTISGPEPDSYGSMLELSWKGTKPIPMPDGTFRKFIQDGDTVSLRGYGQQENYRIGFGDCKAKVLPAWSENEVIATSNNSYVD
jgi:fumarylacetoacetase